MTIDEAIEVLGTLEPLANREPIIRSWDAIKLGIEALKRERARRKNPALHWERLLPEETEEVK